MKNTFVISCPIDTYSGYGARSRDFVKALIELDKFDIQILPQRWGKCAEGFLSNNTEWAFLEKYIIPQIMAKPDYWCQITVPNEFNPIGSYNIGLTAGMETTIVDGSWIEGCNRMDLILTSSNHSKKVFENTQFYKDNNEKDIVKLEKPIEVLFEGVNLDIYFKHLEFKNEDLYNELNDIPEDFTYLTVGHWMQGELGEDRKNIGLTIRAFYELFKNRPSPPALVLKTCIVNGSVMDRSEILRRINIIKNDIQNAKTLPKVYLLHGTLTDTEMNELYNHPKIKAMVSLTKGEGFGRPLLEFSAVDKPIIASNWSGQIDFLKGKFTALVGGKLDKIHKSSVVKNMIIPEAEWFRPELQDVGYAFNVVYEKYDEFLDKAKQQGSYSRDNFSFNKMKDKINEIFKNNLVELPKKLELKIADIEMPKKPTLKKV